MTQHILVVDDSRTVCRIVELLLAPSGHALTLTHDAEAARSAVGTGVDLAVVDMSLPEVDALALARDLRARAGGQLPVILLGSHRHTVTPSDLEQLGNAASIAKPFGADAFLDCIASTLSAPRTPGVAPISDSDTRIDTDAAAVDEVAAEQRTEGDSSAPAFGQSSVPAGPATDVPTSMPEPAFQVPKVPPLNLTGASSARQSHSPPMLGAKPSVDASPAPRPPVGLGASPKPQSFGMMEAGTPAQPAAAPAAPLQAASVPSGATSSTATSAAPSGASNAHLNGALDALKLSAEQRQGVEALITRVVQEVVWEVVPELAESLIREEITRLTAEA